MTEPIHQARVVVVGSSNTDLVLSCATLPRPGETVMGGTLQEYAGGKGANQAVAAARAGAQVFFIGARGADAYGQQAARGLKQEKINISHFRVRPDARSGVALIFLGGKVRQNMIAVAHSANDALTAGDVIAASSLIRTAGIVIAQLEVPLEAVVEAAKLAASYGVPFLLNPAPPRALPKKLLKQIDLLVPNEHEAEFLTGKKDPILSAKDLIGQGCRCVVITLGARGALLADSNRILHFPVPRAKAVDTVGAGDCFTGWLATGMANGLSIENAIRQALRAASLSVTRAGAQPSFPYRAEMTNNECLRGQRSLGSSPHELRSPRSTKMG